MICTENNIWQECNFIGTCPITDPPISNLGFSCYCNSRSSCYWGTVEPVETSSSGRCNDGIDNDCDGNTDAADSACFCDDLSTGACGVESYCGTFNGPSGVAFPDQPDGPDYESGKPSCCGDDALEVAVIVSNFDNTGSTEAACCASSTDCVQWSQSTCIAKGDVKFADGQNDYSQVCDSGNDWETCISSTSFGNWGTKVQGWCCTATSSGWRTNAVKETTYGTCVDGKDNDCNGLADCDDPDCQGTAACPTCSPADGGCSEGVETAREIAKPEADWDCSSASLSKCVECKADNDWSFAQGGDSPNEFT